MFYYYLCKIFIASKIIRYTLRAIGYTVAIARTQDEIDQANSLRIRFNKNFESEESIRKLHEIYDDSSVIFTCSYRLKPVGTLRLMIPEKCQIFDFYELELPKHVKDHNVYEMAGLAVDPKFRKNGNLPLLGLLAASVLYSAQKRVVAWVAFTKPWYFRVFRQFSDQVSMIDDSMKIRVTERNQRYYSEYFAGAGKSNICLIFNMRNISVRRYIKRAFHYSSARRTS